MAHEPATIFFKSASLIESLMRLQTASACASVLIADSFVPFGPGLVLAPAEPVSLLVEPAPAVFPRPPAGAPAL
jgi:hypothetical protein